MHPISELLSKVAVAFSAQYPGNYNFSLTSFDNMRVCKTWGMQKIEEISNEYENLNHYSKEYKAN